MATTMHRLQISLPEWQHQFLLQRARRDDISVAAVIRLLIQREAQARDAPQSENSVWSIAGIAEDRAPLVHGIPVSEAPGLYLADLALSGHGVPPAPEMREKAKRRSRR